MHNKYFKIFNEDLCNHGFQYTLGLNVTPIFYETYPEFGGLFCCDLFDIPIPIWIALYPHGVICQVIIPNNSKVLKLEYKYKTDQLVIVSEPLNIIDGI